MFAMLLVRLRHKYIEVISKYQDYFELFSNKFLIDSIFYLCMSLTSY